MKRQKGSVYDSSKNKNFVYNNEIIANDDPGNIHYGYVGSSSWYPPSLLKGAAGIIQIAEKRSNLDWLNNKNFGDDPHDTEAINKGINLFNNEKNSK